MTEDEMVGWHHRLNGHEFEQTPGGSEGQGSAKCYSHKELDITQRLNNSNKIKGQQTFSAMRQIVNILGFTGHSL